MSAPLKICFTLCDKPVLSSLCHRFIPRLEPFLTEKLCHKIDHDNAVPKQCHGNVSRGVRVRGLNSLRQYQVNHVGMM